MTQRAQAGVACWLGIEPDRLGTSERDQAVSRSGGRQSKAAPDRIRSAVAAALVRQQKRLNPIAMTHLADPIRQGHGGVRHLELLAEGPSETLQRGPGSSPQGAVEISGSSRYRGTPGPVVT